MHLVVFRFIKIDRFIAHGDIKNAIRQIKEQRVARNRVVAITKHDHTNVTVRQNRHARYVGLNVSIVTKYELAVVVVRGPTHSVIRITARIGHAAHEHLHDAVVIEHILAAGQIHLQVIRHVANACGNIPRRGPSPCIIVFDVLKIILHITSEIISVAKHVS